jgi:hypothetical protein
MFGSVNVELTSFLQRVRGTRQIDPDVDVWARRAFAELRQRPLFQPRRDLSRAVLDQIKRIHETPVKFNDGPLNG